MQEFRKRDPGIVQVSCRPPGPLSFIVSLNDSGQPAQENLREFHFESGGDRRVKFVVIGQPSDVQTGQPSGRVRAYEADRSTPFTRFDRPLPVPVILCLEGVKVSDGINDTGFEYSFLPSPGVPPPPVCQGVVNGTILRVTPRFEAPGPNARATSNEMTVDSLAHASVDIAPDDAKKPAAQGGLGLTVQWSYDGAGTFSPSTQLQSDFRSGCTVTPQVRVGLDEVRVQLASPLTQPGQAIEAHLPLTLLAAVRGDVAKPKPGAAVNVPDETPPVPIGTIGTDTVCTIDYGGDGATDSARAEGFVVKEDTASGSIKPTPKSGSTLAVQQKWEHFRIDAKRNLIQDIVKAIEGLAAAVAKAAADNLNDALDEGLATLQPLLNGRKLIYVDSFSYSFTCSSPGDAKKKFKVRHSVSYDSGVTSPKGEDTIHWKIVSNVKVDLPRPELGYESDETKSGKAFGPKSSDPEKTVYVGVGTHAVTERTMIQLTVDDYGEEVKTLVSDLQTLGEEFIEMLESLEKMEKGKEKFLASVLKVMKGAVKAVLGNLKAAVTQTTGTIELKESNFLIECADKETEGAAK